MLAQASAGVESSPRHRAKSHKNGDEFANKNADSTNKEEDLTNPKMWYSRD